MFDVYSEINVRYILRYFMYVPVVATNNQLLSRNLISHHGHFSHSRKMGTIKIKKTPKIKVVHIIKTIVFFAKLLITFCK
jgi:hypothetical protein